jgi:aminobutyraldehyde dehydrogenase
VLTKEVPRSRIKTPAYGKDMSIYGIEDYIVAQHVMVKS